VKTATKGTGGNIPPAPASEEDLQPGLASEENPDVALVIEGTLHPGLATEGNPHPDLRPGLGDGGEGVRHYVPVSDGNFSAPAAEQDPKTYKTVECCIDTYDLNNLTSMLMYFVFKGTIILTYSSRTLYLLDPLRSFRSCYEAETCTSVIIGAVCLAKT
jgi:hypothetical protein